MPVKLVTGNLFESGADVLTNTVNTVGVMGGGLALQFKNRYPEMLEGYIQMCSLKQLLPGHIHIYKHESGNPNFIFNLATKDHWRYPSQMEWIEVGIQHMITSMLALEQKTIATAGPGTGLGLLSFKEVKELIIEKMESQPFTTFLYEPL